jgi:hypothetical protein
MLHKLAQTINVQYAMQLMDGLRTVQLNNVNAAVKILLTLKMDINANNVRIYCRIALSVNTLAIQILAITLLSLATIKVYR